MNIIKPDTALDFYIKGITGVSILVAIFAAGITFVKYESTLYEQRAAEKNLKHTQTVCKIREHIDTDHNGKLDIEELCAAYDRIFTDYTPCREEFLQNIYDENLDKIY